MSLDGPRATSETDADELARQLGAAIAELPAYESFAEARAEVQADAELQDEIAEFEQLREEFALARQSGEATEADLQRVQRAQTELHEDPTMAAFLEAQASLQERLEELNRAISEPLAVDFGGEAGGCCQD